MILKEIIQRLDDAELSWLHRAILSLKQKESLVVCLVVAHLHGKHVGFDECHKQALSSLWDCVESLQSEINRRELGL